MKALYPLNAVFKLDPNFLGDRSYETELSQFHGEVLSDFSSLRGEGTISRTVMETEIKWISRLATERTAIPQVRVQ